MIAFTSDVVLGGKASVKVMGHVPSVNNVGADHLRVLGASTGVPRRAQLLALDKLFNISCRDELSLWRPMAAFRM